ncbi:MAG TPA: AraC family transcriptional regulator ligand-binding domain-containing protein [Polyangiales bacterium]|nr:AraC family transcriptional regulator ligand-binding domain-containing protein [Polyangiales bacterium]
MTQDGESVVAAGIVSAACQSIVRCCGLSKSELMVRAGLDEQLLADPDGTISAMALMALIRCAKERARDPALGLRLASVMDLREQGFWGYAVLSSASLRERIDAHVRYQRMRTPWQLAVGFEAGSVRLEIIPQHVPEDVLSIVIEWLMATALLHFAHHLGRRPRGLVLQLSYNERPHHQQLAELFEGSMRFAAPCNVLFVPAELLDTELVGDPRLQRLAHGQLDAKLAAFQAEPPRPLMDRVRERLAARLDGDASLVRIARDLNLHARNLQRQLDAQHTSFQQLLDEVRHAQAIKLLEDPRQRVEGLAARLGYADAASFRRAFRRWTGRTPADYRAARRSARPTGIVPNPSRKVSRA